MPAESAHRVIDLSVAFAVAQRFTWKKKAMFVWMGIRIQKHNPPPKEVCMYIGCMTGKVKAGWYLALFFALAFNLVSIYGTLILVTNKVSIYLLVNEGWV